MASNGRMRGKIRIGKDLAGTKYYPDSYLGGLKKNTKNLNQTANVVAEIGTERLPRALSLCQLVRLMMLVRGSDILYAAACLYLAIAVIKLWVLCILIKPLVVGTLEFILINFRELVCLYSATIINLCLALFVMFFLRSNNILEIWFPLMKLWICTHSCGRRPASWLY
jgi:hypothetical protein